MQTFFTADTHFDHRNILLHCIRRPWVEENPLFDPELPTDFKENNPYQITPAGVEEHNNALVDNWNDMVGKKDRVFILGDLAWKNHAQFIHRLKGRKIFVSGNHDRMNQEHWKFFAEVHLFGVNKLIGTGVVKGRHKLAKNGKRIFVKKEVRHPVTLCHYPLASWDKSCHGSWHLHGHCHGRMPEFKNWLMFDVGVDVWAYRPVPMEAVILKMREKEGMSDAERSAGHSDLWRLDPEDRMVKQRIRNLTFLRKAGVSISDEEENLLSIEVIK